MPRNKASGPPPYHQNHDPSNRGYNPATCTDGSERSTLLPRRSNLDSQGTSSQQDHSHSTYTDSNSNSEDSYGPPRQTKTSHALMKSLYFFLLIAVGLSVLTFFLYPSTESDHENTRRQWAAEERRQEIMRDSWNSERKAMVEEREAWQKERLDQRKAIVEEKENWHKEWTDQRKAIVEEREQWRKERADHENRERQEEEEKRALIVWEDLKPSTRCLRYGTREYSATLAQVPLGLDPLKECWNKSIDIHGRQMLPTRCDAQGICGNVVGHWTVDFNEATCVTWWRGYDDKGCVERGIHRYESVLENLQNGDDWHEMCATTPGRVQGRDFQGPTSCASWRSGINAIWLVEDENCL